jgi:hypothetical protein
MEIRQGLGRETFFCDLCDLCGLLFNPSVLVAAKPPHALCGQISLVAAPPRYDLCGWILILTAQRSQKYKSFILNMFSKLFGRFPTQNKPNCIAVL